MAGFETLLPQDNDLSTFNALVAPVDGLGADILTEASQIEVRYRDPAPDAAAIGKAVISVAEAVGKPTEEPFGTAFMVPISIEMADKPDPKDDDNKAGAKPNPAEKTCEHRAFVNGRWITETVPD